MGILVLPSHKDIDNYTRTRKLLTLQKASKI